MTYQHIRVPADGEKITVNGDNSLNVPDNPIVPYIEGDGIGIDITPVMLKVVDAAVRASPTGAGGKSPGWKSTPGRSPWNSTARTNGCRRRPLRPCANSWSASRVR